MVLLIIAILGLCFGSFANALVWRVHEQTKKTNRTNKRLSILQGRSMCPSCKHTLASKDLIPLLSWVELRGKCRYCQKSISWQYPLVELATAALFVASYIWWPYGFGTVGMLRFGLWLVFLVGFMALTIYDLRWMLLPDRIVYPLIGIALLQTALVFGFDNRAGVLMSAFWGVVCIAGLFYLLFQVSRGRWIGGGDVKLGVVIGMLVGGPAASLLLLFIASCLGTLAALPLIIMGKKHLTSKLPFGPFLIVATFVVYLFGVSIINWYKRQFLLL